VLAWLNSTCANDLSNDEEQKLGQNKPSEITLVYEKRLAVITDLWDSKFDVIVDWTYIQVVVFDVNKNVLDWSCLLGSISDVSLAHSSVPSKHIQRILYSQFVTNGTCNSLHKLLYLCVLYVSYRWHSAWRTEGEC
jgi:hypothetical protein